ncbi:E3 SUMO-protein ligase ZBED1-like isoform X4 [Phyllopteryx taeniolatus]|uniref:E3 SUMO-protein ligase ZBED1-like isoform X4 n=1 Tax=Phyllopteryx taeniolatus TaxID=161469 RepID=UPI002AD39255|nr:E3 SUMO-protein ligase ZBED1-like isoform X4 [Phyllopteryx taeniolatus]
MLKALVRKRLIAAADEIFGLFERTIASYEEQLCRAREENEGQRRQLQEVCSKTRIEATSCVCSTACTPSWSREQKKTLEDSDTVRDLKAAQDLSKIYANEKETLYMASAVDLWFKCLPFLSDEEAAHFYSRLTDAVVAEMQKHSNVVCAEDDPPVPPSDPNIQPSLMRPRASCSLADLLGPTFSSHRSDAETITDQEAAEKEVTMFVMECPLTLNDDPLNWWMQLEGAYPHVSTVARRFLCLPLMCFYTGCFFLLLKN